MVQQVIQVPDGFNSASVAPLTKLLDGGDAMRDALYATNIQKQRQAMSLANSQVQYQNDLATGVANGTLTDPRAIAGAVLHASKFGDYSGLGPANLAIYSTNPGVTPQDPRLQTLQIGAGKGYNETANGVADTLAEHLKASTASATIAAGPGYAAVGERAREFANTPVPVTLPDGTTGFSTHAGVIAPGSTYKPVITATQAEALPIQARYNAALAMPPGPDRDAALAGVSSPSIYNDQTKVRPVVTPGGGLGFATNLNLGQPGSGGNQPVLNDSQMKARVLGRQFDAATALPPDQQGLALANLDPSIANANNAPVQVMRNGVLQTVRKSDMQPNDIQVSGNATGPQIASRVPLSNQPPLSAAQVTSSAAPILAAQPPRAGQAPKPLPPKASADIRSSLTDLLQPQGVPYSTKPGDANGPITDTNTMSVLQSYAEQYLAANGGSPEAAARAALQWAREQQGFTPGDPHGGASRWGGLGSNAPSPARLPANIQVPTLGLGTAQAPNVQTTKPPAPSFPRPNSDAIAMLQKNPAMAVQFEQMFGPGSSSAYLKAN